MSAYGYTRVSTVCQAEEGVSLAAQALAIEGYCSAYGLELVKIIEDAGESGSTLRRPGMLELRDLVDEGEVSAVVVYKIDRFSRSIRDLFSLLPELDAKGVQFHSVMEKIDTETAMGRAMLGMIGIFSQLEREVTGERTAVALAHIKHKRGGRQINGTAPYGYRWVNGELMSDSEEDFTVDTIRRWYYEQGRSIVSITADLNAREHHKTRSGGQWHRGQVHRILHREEINHAN